MPGACPTDGTNLVARIVRTGLAAFDESGELAARGLGLRCVNAVPQSRGMGSSAAAIVGGLAVAAHLAGVAGSVSDAEMIALATRLEGHPDNVAPGVLGGATIAWMQSGELGPVGRATRFAVHPGIAPVLVIPASEASTAKARGALPGDGAACRCRVQRRTLARCWSMRCRPTRACSSRRPMTGCTSSSAVRCTRRAWPWWSSCAPCGSLRRSPGAGPTVIAFAIDGDGVGLAARILDLVGDSARVLSLPVSDEGVRAL